ncbi:hypothetical protein T02_14499 [Trichinella nativa]|uniref:Uncharacterized protein n=1 Tax=Trichinella nativa TaxID=6335 RepID=A0A0V1LEX4_9BILA|nr:hypothetical protein T02_14499 [Trichinella nativa]
MQHRMLMLYGFDLMDNVIFSGLPYNAINSCRMVGKCALKSKHLNNLVAKRFMLSCENITESTISSSTACQNTGSTIRSYCTDVLPIQPHQ